MSATERTETPEGTTTKGAAPTAAPQLRAALLLVALGCAVGWNLWSDDREAQRPRLAAPPLPAPDARCSASSVDRDDLIARSDEVSTAARSRMARYPFDPAEGMRALALLAEATACETQAGGVTPALARRARAYRGRIEADYRDHVIRVDHALANDELRRAEPELVYLLLLLDGENGAFARRIRNLRAAAGDAIRNEAPR